MPSNFVKCNNCNIVISELLAFVQNKVDVMDEVSLVSICSTAFSEEEICTAKKLLFESVTKQYLNRKGDRKTTRNLNDIITLIKETDPEKLRTFVARELQKLPPVTFDHIDVTRLLKEIVIIQRELKTIQESCTTQYATTDEIKQLKFEIDNLKKAMSQNTVSYVNSKSGAYCLNDSLDCNGGPMGLLPCDERSMTSPNVDASESPTLSRSERTGITPSRSYAAMAGSCAGSVQQQRLGGIKQSVEADLTTTVPNTAKPLTRVVRCLMLRASAQWKPVCYRRVRRRRMF